MASASITRDRDRAQFAALARRAQAVYRPAFPAAWAVPVAAGTLHDAANGPTPARGVPWRSTGHEGPQWYATVAPGLVAFGHFDPARAQRAAERADRARACRVALGVAWRQREDVRLVTETLRAAGLLADDQVLESTHDPLLAWEPRARIREWSAKSRRNMIRRLSTLDYEPLVSAGVPAMVTLTMPDDWECYAPTGRAFKALVRALVKRYERAWRRRLIGLWKLEFQSRVCELGCRCNRRGGPHLHVLMVPPQGTAGGLEWRQWFARSWADVLGRAAELDAETRRRIVAVHEHRKASADYAEGLRAADPKRVAVYFLKHNLLRDKEYQHEVPELWRGEGDGPGRFWGYWGLHRADRAVPLTDRQAVTLARTMRRWEKARAGRRKATVFRVDSTTGAVRRRSVVRRLRTMKATAGFMLVNDGPAVALMLADRLRT